MNTILVTGGAGFLGSHLAEKLLKDEKNYVLIVDNLFTGNKENIQGILDNPRLKFINHDIVEPFNPNGYLPEGTLDQIYNLACPASPVHYQADKIQTVTTNVVGTRNMLELASKHKARILQASTSEVYGDPLEHPQKETYRGNVNTMGPRACYDVGKMCAETLMFSYNHDKGTDIRVARIFNTYGPRLAKNDGRVISNFILQALNNEDITIFGEGQQTRSFCYVSDLVEGLVSLMNSKPYTEPVNLGNPGEFTMLELANLVIDMTGSDSKIVHMPLPQDDPKQRQPDITKAKQFLGWEPKISLKEGLKYTIDYFVNKS